MLLVVLAVAYALAYVRMISLHELEFTRPNVEALTFHLRAKLEITRPDMPDLIAENESLIPALSVSYL